MIAKEPALTTARLRWRGKHELVAVDARVSVKDANVIAAQVRDGVEQVMAEGGQSGHLRLSLREAGTVA